MTPATKYFIEQRQKWAKQELVLKDVKQIGGGAAGQCVDNAIGVARASILKPRKAITISGWLIQPYDPKNKCNALIQHWWNADQDGNHFDTTPLAANGQEYVTDMDLFDYCALNHDKISTNLGLSLLLEGTQFSLLIDPANMRFLPVRELRTELFYRHAMTD